MRGTMLLDGKLGRRRELICALGGLVYLQDANSKQNFLVDTGAAVSVFPHKSNSPSPDRSWQERTESRFLHGEE